MTHRAAAATCIAAFLLIGPGRARAQEKNNPYLEAIGALAAANAFTSYAYVGAVSDAFEKKAYTAKQVRARMDELSGFTTNVQRYLKQLNALNITETDKTFVTELIDILELVGRQASALKEFAGVGLPGQKQRYQDAKALAWPRIKKLLKLP